MRIVTSSRQRSLTGAPEPGLQPLETGVDSDGDRLLEDDVVRVPGVLERLDVLVRDLVGVLSHLVEIRGEVLGSLAIRDARPREIVRRAGRIGS